MNPAPNATRSSMTRSSRTARRVTANAPSTLPAAAMSACSNALDTREQVFFGVAGWILEYFVEESRQRFAHIRAGPHAGRDQIVSLDRQILECQRLTRRAD